jgi:spermidine/putrescine transport system permease protein
VTAPATAAPSLASPARAAGTTRLAGGGPARRRQPRSLVEGWFRGHTALVYVFLYLPIVVVIVFSFNGTNRLVTDWQGFSIKWYQAALADRNIQQALWNSVTIAAWNAVLATTFGTMAALGLQRVAPRVRSFFDALTYVSVIIPEIVIALATLILFSNVRDVVNPVLAGFQAGAAKPVHLQLGQWSVIAAHVLFNLSLVLLLVRARLAGMDRTHVEASYDLYATPWRTFRQITFPQLLPAIVAGFLLSFTFSLDDYVITQFVSGPGSQTLPLFIFGQTRLGVTPLTNAIAALMLLFTLTVLLGGQLFLARHARRRGGGRDETMAGLIVS